jgi:hypothetical protein
METLSSVAPIQACTLGLNAELGPQKTKKFPRNLDINISVCFLRVTAAEH